MDSRSRRAFRERTASTERACDCASRKERNEPRPGAIALPGWVIDAVAPAPGGSRPSYSLGITERDNDFYKFWDKLSRDRGEFEAWMRANVIEGALA